MWHESRCSLPSVRNTSPPPAICSSNANVIFAFMRGFCGRKQLVVTPSCSTLFPQIICAVGGDETRWSSMRSLTLALINIDAPRGRYSDRSITALHSHRHTHMKKKQRKIQRETSGTFTVGMGNITRLHF